MMKRFWKRFVAAFLAALMVISTLPAHVFAEEEPSVEVYPRREASGTATLGTLEVVWNDSTGNKDEDWVNRENRPALDEVEVQADISFVLKDAAGNAVGEPVLLTEETCGLIGLEHVPAIAGDDSSLPSYKYTISGFPTSVRETILVGEGDSSHEETTVYSIEYSYEAQVYAPGGYLDTTSEEDEDAEPRTKWQFTAEYDWTAELEWKDNSNLYQTRPSGNLAEYFNVYRFVSGESFSKEDILEADTYTLEIEEDNLRLTPVPAYNEEGKLYVYCVELKTEDETISAGNQGEYLSTYDNKDNFSTNTDVLFENGTLTLLLSNMTNFVVTKIWEDGEASPASRPQTVLRLYRVSEDENGEVSVEKVTAACPVQGYDMVDVSRDASEVQVFFGDSPEASPLPMYDISGHRYVYFALETGVRGDYRVIINNADSVMDGMVNADVKDLFDDITVSGRVKYVLNHGEIKNDQEAPVSIDATKLFVAQAMQSMVNTEVTFILQYYDADAGEWKNVGKDQVLDESVLDENGNVTKVFSGFSQEAMGQEAAGPQVQRYVVETGDYIEYRWVETSMTVNGGESVDVSINADGTYEVVNAGEVGPRVGGTATTALFQPAYEEGSQTVIINTLVGGYEVKVRKTWYMWDEENGKHVNISGDEETLGETEAQFLLYQNGVLYKTVTMTLGNNYEETENAWIHIWDDLPHYDEHGKEYVYTVEEGEVINKPFDFYTEYYYENGTVNRENIILPETRAYYDNYEYGDGFSLEFDITKQWLDDGDLLSRKPVVAGVYAMDGTEPLVTVTLDESNQWTARVFLSGDAVLNADGSRKAYDDFVVKEVSVGGLAPVYSATNEEIFALAADAAYGPVTNPSDASDPYQSAHIVGTITPVLGNTEYFYNVFVQRTRGTDESRNCYTISNQRVAVLSLELTKTWVTGGIDIDAVNMDATFVVLKDGEKMSLADVEIESELARVNEDGSITLDVNSAAEKNGVYTATILIPDLPKYDHDGSQFEYTLVETFIGDSEFSDQNGLRLATVDGNTYVSSLGKNEDKTHIAGPAYFHSGDFYAWEGRNYPQDSYELTANKVWRDDGGSAQDPRPDVTFKVYRVSSSVGDLLERVNAIADADDKSVMIEALIQELMNYESKWESLGGDRFWNTRHNSWFWSCDIGSVDRYDGQGYPYIYFVKEIYTGNPGVYHAAYCNIPGEDPSAFVPEGGTTKDVLDTPLEELDGAEALVILADGVNTDSADGVGGYGTYYSRTTVNYREDTRTVSGRKLWMMPSGWMLPESDSPVVVVDLYRISGPVNFSVFDTFTVSELNAMIADLVSQGSCEWVNTRTLSRGNYAFHFTTEHCEAGETPVSLPRYDEYGRAYTYLVTENTEESGLHNYLAEESEVALNNFYIKNIYTLEDVPNVRVEVSKTWDVDLHETGDRAALFTLYAQQQDEGGNLIANPVKMSEIVVGYSQDNPVTTAVFDMYTADGGDQPLPYYGPNNRPLVYWVVENPIQGYTVDTQRHEVALTKVSDDLYSGVVSYTNTYTGGSKVSIERSKTWDDSDNSMNNEAYRPNSISVEIWRSWGTVNVGGCNVPGGNELVAVMTMTKANGWKISMNDLPEYGPNGAAYTYYIAGDGETGTTTEDAARLDLYTGNRNGNNLKNTLKTFSLKAEKRWFTSGSSNAAMSWDTFRTLRDLGALPTTVTLYVQRRTEGGTWSFVSNNLSGSKLEDLQYRINVATLNSGNYNSNKTFTKLPVYELGTNAVYEYRIVEKLIWADGSETWFYGNGESANQTLQQSGSAFAPETAERTGNTTPQNAGSTLTQTIKNTVPVVSLAVDKAWEDNGNRDNTRPTSLTITFTAYKETAKEKSLTLTVQSPNAQNQPGNTWSYSSVLVPMVDSGWTMDDVYAIDEAVISNYNRDNAAEYTSGDTVITLNHFVAADGTDSFTYHLRNILEDRPRDVITVEAAKVFSGDTGAMGNEDSAPAYSDVVRPTVRFKLQYLPIGSSTWTDITAEIRDQFFMEGNANAPAQIVEINGTTGSVDFGELHRYWSRTTDSQQGLPDEIEYRIIEEMLDESGNVITTTSYSAGGSGDLDDYTYTNSLQTKTLKVAKVWTYSDTETTITRNEINALVSKKLLPETIRIQLAVVNPDHTVTVLGTQDISVIALSGGAQNWAIGLPVYDKNGQMITYQLSEIAVKFQGDNEFKDIAAVQGMIASDPVTAQAGNAASFQMTMTNVLKTTDVAVEKKWEDANNQDGFRPASVRVQLLADGSVYQTQTVTANSNGNWQTTFRHLPLMNAENQEIIYTIQEVAPDGSALDDQSRFLMVSGNNDSTYSVSYTGDASSGYTITNTHEVIRISVSVIKEWVDESNRDGKRAVSITVALLADGEVVETRTLTAANAVSGNSDQWRVTFMNLDKYANGQEIVYTVREKDGETLLAGGANVTLKDGGIYTVSYSGNPTEGLVISNIHGMELTDVAVTKVWDDTNDQDGKRAESVTFQLFADGEAVTGKTLTLNSENLVPGTNGNQWSGTFTSLPKYKDGQVGQEIVYTVREMNGDTVLENRADYLTVEGDADSVYTVTYSGDYKEGLVVTNTHEICKITVQITKRWEDKDNQDGKRQEVTFQLFADGEAVIRNNENWTITLGEEDQAADDESGNIWFGVFSDLDKYAEGQQIVYTIYEVSLNAEGEITYLENADTFRMDDGDDESVYTVEYRQMDEDGYVYEVTNTHEVITVDISVTKRWDDGDNHDGKRREVTFQLFADGEAVIRNDANWTITLGEEDQAEDDETGNVWVGSFEGLDKYRADEEGNTGIRIEYTIREVDIDADGQMVYLENESDYLMDNEDADSLYTVTYVQTDEDGYTYEVTNTHEICRVAVSVTKRWDDGDNQDGKRREVTFQLFADGEAVVREEELWTITLGEEDQTDEDETGNTWIGSFDGLDKYREDEEGNKGIQIEYTIREVMYDEEGEAIYLDNEDAFLINSEDTDSEYTVTYAQIDEDDCIYEVTNTHETCRIDVKIAKVWDDVDDQDGKREEVTFQLFAIYDGSSVMQPVEADGHMVMLQLNDENLWTNTFTDLDKYYQGMEILYFIREITVDGEVVEDGMTFLVNAEDADSEYTAVYSGTYLDILAVTNTHETVLTDVPVFKVWEDNSDQDGFRGETVTLVLLADGVEVRTVILSADDADETGNVWVYTFTGLDKYKSGKRIVYTVEEKGVDEDHYTVSYEGNMDEGFTVTNTHEIEKTRIQVTKFWVDGSDWHQKRADSVTIVLYADGEEVQKLTLTQEDSMIRNGVVDGNTWIGSFENLDKYADGKEIEYTVKEEGETNGSILMKDNVEYVVEYSGDAENGYEVTNTYEFGKPGVPPGWVWDEVQGIYVPKPEDPRPNTGDDSQVDLWMLLSLTSLAGLVTMGRIRKRRN